jgi:hypothetical protein
MALFPNSDGTDQGSRDSLECNCINVCFHGKNCGDRVGGAKVFESGFLVLWFWEEEWIG